MGDKDDSYAGTCAHCGDDASLKCGHCKMPYCKKTCQKAHWKVHKKSCSSLAQKYFEAKVLETYDHMAQGLTTQVRTTQVPLMYLPMARAPTVEVPTVEAPVSQAPTDELDKYVHRAGAILHDIFFIWAEKVYSRYHSGFEKHDNQLIFSTFGRCVFVKVPACIAAD